MSSLLFLPFYKPNTNRSQEAVFAVIIQNSAARNFTKKTEVSKTRADRVTTQILNPNYSSFPTKYKLLKHYRVFSNASLAK